MNLVRRKSSWRERSLDDIKKRLMQEETGYVLGKITGEIETPSPSKVQSFRQLIGRLMRTGQLGKTKAKKIKWHDDGVLRRKIRRLRRRVRRIEEGKYKPSTKAAKEEQGTH